jgi:hypothetical protein
MRYIVFILIFTFIYADKYVEATYDISYGIFGKLGKSKAIVKVTGDRYKISIKAKATGLANTLSGGRTEEYVSIGQYSNDKYIPQIFTTIKTNGNEQSINIYNFDYKNRVITRNYSTYELNDKKWEHQGGSVTNMDYFANEDLLTIFFNLKTYSLDLSKGKAYSLTALGANNNDGRIDIIAPTKSQLKDINSVMHNDDKKIIVIINQKIFSSPKGELYISLRSDGICSSAILKDILLFGDIKGKLNNLKGD